ncbi:cytochrome P450 [Crepidotus variabilis]|uniref:Cytochrome P450 n=1 Tax=Crepidotus variabilis TaxID=179855 RepID=A0A9P6JS66_9AGAR|nr:cytochrome P450 [Crepidotus variabilis]
MFSTSFDPFRWIPASSAQYETSSRAEISAVNVTLAALAIVVVSSFLKHRRGLKAVGYFPGLRVPFFPMGFPGVVLPTTWWNPGYLFLWNKRLTNYAHGTDTFSVVSFLIGEPCFYTANLDVLRQVAGGSHKTSFLKPEHHSIILLLWGMNLLAADGEVWRKHRRVVAPAFNNKLYRNVWTRTIQTYKQILVGEKWADQKESRIPSFQTITSKLTLLIIGQCGFGFQSTWFDPPKTADGRMSVHEALKVVGDSHVLAAFLPNWIMKLPFKRFQEALEAHDRLEQFMKDMVVQKKADAAQKGFENEKDDMFTMLVKANEDETSKFKLDDQELIGNIFIMLFAGHESTAHSLAAAIGLLSAHQDIQEEIYQQVLSVCGTDGEPTFEDYDKLDKVLAVFYEAVRLFPAAHVLIRSAWEDTVLHIPKCEGQEGRTDVAIPEGTTVIVDMVGIQYNPRYFPDPTSFRPSRWYGLSNDSDSFSAFSVGPRACVGRKFALLEAVAFLTSLLRDFSIHPILNMGESVEQWKERVLDAKLVVTLGVKDVPIRLVRRTSVGQKGN